MVGERLIRFLLFPLRLKNNNMDSNKIVKKYRELLKFKENSKEGNLLLGMANEILDEVINNFNLNK